MTDRTKTVRRHRRGIPSVKRWLVRFARPDHTSDTVVVFAPTRKLAILNFRFEDGGAFRFAPIRSVGWLSSR